MQAIITIDAPARSALLLVVLRIGRLLYSTIRVTVVECSSAPEVPVMVMV
jgi:hypothetical protein